MLLKLSDPVSECLRRAEECGRRARTAPDAHSIDHYLRMEQRWLFLANSQQFAERVSRFIGERTSEGLAQVPNQLAAERTVSDEAQRQRQAKLQPRDGHRQYCDCHD